MTVINIRPATVNDALGIAKVHVDVWNTTYTGIISQEVLDERTYEKKRLMWKNILDEQKDVNHCFVATNIIGEIVGFIAGGTNREKELGFECEIYAIYIQKNFQHTGIGRQLFEASLEQFIRNGYSSMMIWDLERNTNACKFYETMGGKVVGTKLEDFGDRKLKELAYGWNKLSTITSATALPILYSDRLLLRPLTPKDSKSIFAYASDPEVSRFTLWDTHKTEADSANFIREYALKNYSAKIPEPWGIAFLDQPNTIIGTIGCFWVSKDDHCMELAYAIGKDYWGKGIVVESAKLVLDFIFNNFKVERIQCRCKVENKASARVMEKLGFKYEGILRHQIFHQNRYWDMYHSAILKNEWINE
ncbi:MAG: GNAT family N-acetyltransferase [Oligoflexales bacterium]|nr:GNAT family N-acetyltransferase [Oligoflexales bacterium]